MVGQPRFFHVEVHPLEEKKALREAGALLLADQAASIVVLQVLYFLASKNTEEPGTTAVSKCLPPLPSLRGLGLTSVLSETRCPWDVAMLAAPGKPLSSWEMKESTRVCQSGAQGTLCSFVGSTWAHSGLAPSMTPPYC